MSNMTEQSTVATSDETTSSQPSAKEIEFTKTVNDMATDQAPQMFAVALEYGAQLDVKIAAWGMAFDEHAYMITEDDNRQFVLADADGALKYFPKTHNVTPRLIWVTPSPITDQN
ncbi:hypothetical protein [Kibdelosporangium aridum]|uniref:Uncharacterized protein n=1 Tax=Kibdelosporangium aridum TaxID=2030 RepID=A0A1W2G063_KIBAR|nr:hypothetical protein [Kibdelosporangium aridum]SMD27597.1 hypothetical protein SAMN05661093_11207 [Kibdelosporangium aridum]